MIQVLYIIAFTALSILAISNLIRSMLSLAKAEPATQINRRLAKAKYMHPELLDQQGNISQEPLLVMRAYTIDDARARLDALYDASSNPEI